MTINILLLVTGGVGVWLGAEGMVRGAVKLAAWLGIPSLIVGLTVVAFGTSAPELVVSSMASFRGHNELALGNVIGSNIINISLVLGISALMAPLTVSSEVLRRDIPIVVVTTFAVVLMALLGNTVGRIDAVVLLTVFAGYVYLSYRLAVREQQRTTMSPNWERPELHWHHIAFLIGGIVVLAAGAEGMVRGAVGIAESMGISKRIIGMTIVAFGTSLPELAASVVAARHGESDLALGNVVGSNMYNMTLILGTAAMISPIPCELSWRSPEVVFFLATAVMLLPLCRIGWRLSRIDGAILLALYAAAVGFLFV